MGDSKFYLILSFFSFLFIFLFSIFDVSDKVFIDFFERLFVGLFFIISCFFGILFAWYPGWYKKFYYRKSSNNNIIKNESNKIRKKGHHPDCKNFYDHVIKLKNRTYCAGCFGISFGCLLSIFLMFLYIWFDHNITNYFFYIFLVASFIVISLIYLEILFLLDNKIIHIFSNICLILSFLIITISIFEITKNISYAILCILLSFLWINTRVQLSNNKHKLICKNCNKSCKMY